MLQEFVDEFGPTRLIRECTETDLREFYQRLRFKPTISQNSAAVFVGRVQGMLKAAQEAKPDLINWPSFKSDSKVNGRPQLCIIQRLCFSAYTGAGV